MKQMLALLQSLIDAYGPPGQEKEVRDLCSTELQPLVDEMWEDAAGNLIGKIQGRDPAAPPVRLMAHMDEIAMIVKKVNEDGSLRLNPLGGSYPGSFGQGVVDILGDREVISGILSFGSMHTTKESSHTNRIMPKEFKGEGLAPFWDHVHVITRKTIKELAEAGIHPGTRVVIARSRRTLHAFQDCVAGYFLDNRASIAIVIEVLKQLRAQKKTPQRDLYLVFTASEEIGAQGACYAARTLPGDLTIAIDVGPVAKEYQTVLSADPIIVYQDAVSTYDKTMSDQLVSIGKQLNMNPQYAVFETYGSDASIAYKLGQSAKAALVCFPVENTHGYEVMQPESMKAVCQLLVAYLTHPIG